MDLSAFDIVEHPDVTYSQPGLWTRQASQAFDPRLARLGRLMAQMPLNRILHRGPEVSLRAS